MIFDKLKAYGWMVAAIAAGGLLLAQTVRLHNEQRAHDKLKVTVAQDDKARTDSALKHEIKTSADESAHAAATQENSDDFTTSQPVRDAISRADLDRIDRLRINAERRAATYLAQAKSNAAACSDLADRHAALDAHIVNGAEVVGALRSDLARRDAEVKLLRQQIDTDRALIGDGN
jgi:hypothetical protein